MIWIAWPHALLEHESLGQTELKALLGEARVK